MELPNWKDEIAAEFSQGMMDIAGGLYTENNSDIFRSVESNDYIDVKMFCLVDNFKNYYPKLSDGHPFFPGREGGIYDMYLYNTRGDPKHFYSVINRGGILVSGVGAILSRARGDAFTYHVESFWNGWYGKWIQWRAYRAYTESQSIKINWSNFVEKLKLAYPISSNKVPVGMVSAAVWEVSGSIKAIDWIASGLISPSFLLNLYLSSAPISNSYLVPISQLQPEVIIDKFSLTSTFYAESPHSATFPIYISGIPKAFNPLAEYTHGFHQYNSTQVNDYCWSLPINLSSVRVYFADKDSNWADVQRQAISNRYELIEARPGSDGSGSHLSDAANISGFSGSITSDKISFIEGRNVVNVFSGNSIIPFNSIYMSGDTYNTFVSAGGGVVAESGIFPNDRDTMYITDIDLSLNGNSMTVLQNSDFDSTPLLTLNEKVHGFIINSSGDYECSFAGFVYSIGKYLDGRSEYIKYECRCLKSYLSQIYTPSYFIYKPPPLDKQNTAKTYEQIIKELFIKIGLTNADINMPNINAPDLEYNFTQINNVLENLVSYLGKYVYYVTKNGILTIKATDSGMYGAGRYRIPSRGEAVGSNKVLSFMPIQDSSLSRSKVILTGDYAVREIEEVVGYRFSNEKIDPRKCTKSGIFSYYDSNGNRIWYFMFRPGKTIVTPLISNSEVSAEFAKINSGFTSHYRGSNSLPGLSLKSWRMYQELPIEYINQDLGNSFYYMWRWVRPDLYSPNSGTILQHTHCAIQQRYCVRDDNPIIVSKATGYSGGIEVIKVPEFKKIISTNYNRDDTALMSNYAALMAQYFKPTYGGQLVIDGLENQLNLLDRVSITNTNLTSDETNNLAVHSIHYDLVNRKTTLELSNKVYLHQPYFDFTGEIKRREAERENKLDSVVRLTRYKARR